MKRVTSLLAVVLALAVATPATALEKPKGWEPPPPAQVPNFRADMREVVVTLANYAKGRKRDFIVLVHNGVELAVKGRREVTWEELRDPDGRAFEKRLPEGAVYRPYVRNIDGVILDGLFCGPDAFGKPLAKAMEERKAQDRQSLEDKAKGIQRPAVPSEFGPFSIDPQEELRRATEIRRKAEREERQRRTLYAIQAMQEEGRRVLSMETCKAQKDVSAAYDASDRDRVLSYAGTGPVTLVPKGHPRAENANPVSTVTAARNWLPMLRGDAYGSKAEWVQALRQSNEDLLVVDVAHRGDSPLNREDVAKLKFKELGSPRLVLAVLPVGKAFDWRWYWKTGWEAGNPPFLFAPDTEHPGSFVTVVADPQWRELLGKYLTGILDMGFDGVVLDDVDTYLWFEDLMPLDG